jgi:hypothetical protein
MECTIGNLGQEIHQLSNPYANLSQEGLQCCQVNTLLSVLLELDKPPKGLPAGSVDLRDGYALLCKCDQCRDLHISEWVLSNSLTFQTTTSSHP